MSKLTKYSFSELYDMSSGISSTPAQAGHGAPFASFSTVFNNYFLPDVLPDLMNTSGKEQITYSIKKDDILLTRTSETIDELAFSCVATRDYPSATYSGFTKRLRPNEKGKKTCYAKYMAFYLRSYLFRKLVTNNAFMTLRASFNETIFSFLYIYLPEYHTQVKIGDFLYTIEKKIKLNNRINAELEAMAKTLYDYWFVQFDFPDKDGKPYKSSGGTMVYNEELKRDIPEGWEVVLLKEFIKIKKGILITEKTAQTNGQIKVVSAGITHSYYHDKANYPANTITVSASGANAGFINFWREPIFACDCTAIRDDTLAKTLFALQFLKCNQAHIYKQARGSAQPHVYPKDIEALKTVVPPQSLLESFGERLIAGNKKMENIQQENQELAKLRDWLLPMLMNGQVSLSF